MVLERGEVHASRAEGATGDVQDQGEDDNDNDITSTIAGVQASSQREASSHREQVQDPGCRRDQQQQRDRGVKVREKHPKREIDPKVR